MCGICGLRGNTIRETVRRMNSAMIHRGPDSEGYYAGETCELGMRRLKIIDLDGSDQPIYNEDKSIVIVCNGEIYNYRELRTQLRERGHQFTTDGDVETIVHLYEEYGDDCVRKLDGMFAFALWDERKNRLLLARDRLGVKPLYFCDLPGQFIFASEIRAILASGLVPPELNEESIIRYISYPAVPAPLTIFKSIVSLLPGHMVRIDNAGVRVMEYWDVDFMAAKHRQIKGQDAVDFVQHQLTESVRKRLVSDVPLGAFLSGGIDSSSVVALMGSLLELPVRTFSIRFTGSGDEFKWFDDASFATRVSEIFHTEHTEEVVTGEQVNDNLIDAVWAMDQPSGDAIQYYLVSQSARKGVTVALSGTGGDEVFAGYEWFKELRQIDAIHKRYGLGIRNAGPLILALIRLIPRTYQFPAGIHKLETLFLGSQRFIDRYRLNRRMYRNRDWPYIFSPDFLQRIPGLDFDSEPRFSFYADRCDDLDPIARTSYMQLKTDMTNLLLRDQDAVSMAHSLEVRLPLIDHTLVELAARIPSDLKLHGNEEKFILRKALSHLLPEEITQRSKKGFIFPMGSWMRNELRPVVESCLSEAATKKRGIFNVDTTKQLKKDFFAGKQPFFKVWNQVVFELWCRITLDREHGWLRPAGCVKDFI
jgi:asparagine synthase (glutamine-hydrolysing)